MIKTQHFADLELGSEYPTLQKSLVKISNQLKEENNGQFAEVHQVIPHSETRFTVIINLYSNKIPK